MMNPTFHDFLPQGEEIQMLQQQIQLGKMVHALLITGESGTGKRTLAHLIAAALLCRNTGLRPCGECNNCFQTFNNEHPDLILICKGSPLTNDSRKGRTTIPIDDIREMIRLSSVYPFEEGNRVILIENAEDMTPQAQNCLLKILEEPPANTFFLLTSTHPEKVLITVKSRCRTLKMKPWDDKHIVMILTESGIDTDKARLAAASCHGSIGYAKQLVADEDYWRLRDSIISAFFSNGERSRVFSISNQWKDNKNEAEKLFDILEDCVQTMLKYRISRKEDETLKLFSNEWQFFSSNADYERFLYLLKKVYDARRQFRSNVSIQAIVEQLLLSFIGEIK